MIFKPKIKSILKHIPLLLLALVCVLTINSIEVHATEDAYTAWAQSYVDLVGSSVSGGNKNITYGVAYNRTGYLCYLLDKNGNKVEGTNAVALSSPGFNYYTSESDTQWRAVSRKGNYYANTFSGEAPWAVTPWDPPQGSSKICPTNEPDIRAWFETTDDKNNQGGTKFVYKNWQDKTEGYVQGDYVIVIETLMHFKYSEKSTGEAPPSEADLRAKLTNTLARIKGKTDTQLMKEGLSYGLTEIYDNWSRYMTYYAETKDRKWLEDAQQAAYSTRTYLLWKVENEFKKAIEASKETVEAGLWIPIGDFVIGTVPNLIDYKGVIGTNTTVFDSYLNKVAPFAERINSGDIGEEIGFTAWTGSTTSKISNAQVKGPTNTAGLATIVISAGNNPGINTYSPPEGSPGPAEDPTTNPSKQGSVTIVKGYYTEDELTQTKVSDGVYTQPNTTNKINIMEEPEYQLVSWNISTSEPTTPDPAGAWISTPKGGITPTSVTLETNEKTLYVLLKKVEAAPPEVGNELWVLEESEITAQVSTANKAASNGTDLKLTVTLPTLEKCNGHYKEADPGHSADCEETCTQSHKYGWTDYCTSWTLDDKSFSLITKNTNEDNTATSKNVLAKDSLTSRNILFRNQVKAYPESSGKCFIFLQIFSSKVTFVNLHKSILFQFKMKN